MLQTHPSRAFRLVDDARRRRVHTPPRVLVAEDDPEMRTILVRALRRDGYAVTELTDGGRLLVTLGVQIADGDHEIDLIISDIRMPVCSGLDIVSALRQAHWSVPVILMTAFPDDETLRRAEELHAVLFHKPFALEDLRTAVLNMVPPR